MAFSSALFLKGIFGVGTVAASSAAAWWLLKDKISYTQLDNEIFDSNSNWKTTLDPATNSSTVKEITITATISDTSKSWTCKISGKSNADISDTTEIKKQIDDLTTNTGLPNKDETDGSTRKKDNSQGYAFKKFFENCIRNRTEEEKTSSSKEGSSSATSTIRLTLIKDNNKYKFKEDEFKKLYEGVIYGIKEVTQQ